jgi:hypothetical protein
MFRVLLRFAVRMARRELDLPGGSSEHSEET